MKSVTDDVSSLRSQLAEKSELVAVLTSQLEKSATQLDRMLRSGADRQGPASSPASPGIPAELAGKLSGVLDDWQEFQPAERIERIESGIDQLLGLVKSLQSAALAPSAAHYLTPVPPAVVTPVAVPAAPLRASRATSNEEFWAAEKARLLGEEYVPPVSVQAAETVHPVSSPTSTFSAIPSAPIDHSIYAELGAEPDVPTPVSTIHDTDELLAGVRSRDTYIQYLTARLRIAESHKLLPVSWDQLATAPDRFRDRLESLETLLKDHLRQAEVAHSLERALLARERAKLALIKQNLETQIKRMAQIGATTTTAPPSEMAAPDAKVDPESRWKRIFSR